MVTYPDLQVGENLDGVKVKFRNDLETFDHYLSPYLLDSRITVEGYRSDYYLSGTWATELDLSSVVRACGATLNYEAETPPQTQVIAKWLSKKGIQFKGDWAEVGDGGDYPTT